MIQISITKRIMNSQLIELSIKKMTLSSFINKHIDYQTIWNNLFIITDRYNIKILAFKRNYYGKRLNEST